MSFSSSMRCMRFVLCAIFGLRRSFHAHTHTQPFVATQFTSEICSRGARYAIHRIYFISSKQARIHFGWHILLQRTCDQSSIHINFIICARTAPTHGHRRQRYIFVLRRRLCCTFYTGNSVFLPLCIIRIECRMKKSLCCFVSSRAVDWVSPQIRHFLYESGLDCSTVRSHCHVKLRREKK